MRAPQAFRPSENDVVTTWFAGFAFGQAANVDEPGVPESAMHQVSLASPNSVLGFATTTFELVVALSPSGARTVSVTRYVPGSV